MSRQLDLQIYLARNGYELKVIPEERFEDYMSEPNYSTDAGDMLLLDKEMRRQGHVLSLRHHGATQYLAIYTGVRAGWGLATAMPLAVSLAAYMAFTARQWEEQ